MKSSLLLDRTRMPGIVKATLATQIEMEIRERILDGRLSMGDRIWAADIASELGVSIAPVKEALIALQNKGLVNNIPRRGTVVRYVDKKDAEELYFIRRMIECESVTVALDQGSVTPDVIAKLRGLNQSIKQDIRDNQFQNPALIYRLDRSLHECLVELTGNETLIEVHRTLLERAQSVMFRSLNMLPRGDLTASEHDVIIDALERQDARAAKQAITTHLAKVLEDIKVTLPSTIPTKELPPGRRSSQE